MACLYTSVFLMERNAYGMGSVIRAGDYPLQVEICP